MITFLLIQCAFLTTNAQHLLPEGNSRAGHRALPALRGGEITGEQYYLETFDTGLGDWTIHTTQGSVHWKWTETGPGPTPSFYAVPPLNTTPGWAILDDDHDGHLGHTCTSSLISPVIDLSAAPTNLKLQFDQYFQEFQSDNTYVGVSTNGGTTWTEVEINQGVGRDNRPNPETVVLNISSMVAADPSNVRLRFRYDANWAYGWQLDNIGIYEPPPHELVLEWARLSNTGTNLEYFRIPASQLGPELFATAVVKNAGSLTLTNVVVNVEIKNEAGAVLYSGNTAPVQLQAWESVTLEHVIDTPLPGEGLYQVRYMASSAEQELDVDLDNNVLLRHLEINDMVYALDGLGVHPEGIEQTAALGTDSFEGVEDGLYLLNCYTLLEPVAVTGIRVNIHGGSVPGSYVYGVLLDSMRVIGGFVSPTLGESGLYDITQADIDAGVIDLVFPEPVIMNPGSYYAGVALHSISGASHIRVVDDRSIPRANAAALIHVVGSGTYGDGNAFAIRMLVDPSVVSVHERHSTPGIWLMPNPTTGPVTIRPFSTDAGELEVLDMQGSWVYTGRFTGLTTFDLGHLAPGVYMVLARGNGKVATVRLLKE